MKKKESFYSRADLIKIGFKKVGRNNYISKKKQMLLILAPNFEKYKKSIPDTKYEGTPHKLSKEHSTIIASGTLRVHKP